MVLLEVTGSKQCSIDIIQQDLCFHKNSAGLRVLYEEDETLVCMVKSSVRTDGSLEKETFSLAAMVEIRSCRVQPTASSLLRRNAYRTWQ